MATPATNAIDLLEQPRNKNPVLCSSFEGMDAAAGLDDKAKEYLQKLKSEEGALGPNHPHLAELVLSLADLHEQQGKLDEAEAGYGRALLMREAACADQPNNPVVSEVLHSLAGVHKAQKRLTEAESGYRKAVAMMEVGTLSRACWPPSLCPQHSRRRIRTTLLTRVRTTRRVLLVGC